MSPKKFLGEAGGDKDPRAASETILGETCSAGQSIPSDNDEPGRAKSMESMEAFFTLMTNHLSGLMTVLKRMEESQSASLRSLMTTMSDFSKKLDKD